MIPFLRLSLRAPVLFACLMVTAPLHAADLGGDCCAELEERIAELEAATPRKGNRKVSLSVAGHVNSAVLFWDDGHESSAYVVGNKNDQDDGTAGFVVWESYWYLASEKLGQLSMGQVSRVSDTAPENDLSETGSTGYAGVGSFLLRLTDGTPTGVRLGDLYSHLNGDTANVVRYDTPVIAGFVLSASWGEDDMWDVGARYEGDFNSIKIAASIACTHDTDENGLDGDGGDGNLHWLPPSRVRS